MTDQTSSRSSTRVTHTREEVSTILAMFEGALASAETAEDEALYRRIVSKYERAWERVGG